MAKKAPSPRTISSAEKQLAQYASRAAGTTERSDELVEQSIKESEGKTRDRMARQFMTWYFGILLLLIIGVPVFNLVAHQLTGGNDYTITLLDLIQGYSSIVGPLFGFVIAYYFKTKNE